MDSLEFLAKSSESWFDDKGNLLSRPLFETRIKLKKGTRMTFIDQLKERVDTQEPSYLKFFLPSGLETTAEIRGYSIPVEYPSSYDLLDIYVTLTQEQEWVLFPNPNDRETFGY